MNREEAKTKLMTIYGSLSEELKKAIDVLVDAPKSELEQMGEMGNLFAEATKDCVSRKAVEEITWEEPDYSDKYNVLTWVRDKVRELTPTTPDLSEFIDKLYKLAYERGKKEGLNIPEGTTNGDVIKSIAKREPFIDTFGSPYMVFKKEWWDAPYKQEGKE